MQISVAADYVTVLNLISTQCALILHPTLFACGIILHAFKPSKINFFRTLFYYHFLCSKCLLTLLDWTYDILPVETYDILPMETYGILPIYRPMMSFLCRPMVSYQWRPMISHIMVANDTLPM